MTFELPPSDQLKNESDVEQKFILPLLTASEPYGFGIKLEQLSTKANIRRLMIGKGAESKLYFPDYLIIIGGFPLVVIEAKAPGEDLSQAYREARLYASEVNALFSSGLNPVNLVVATDGVTILAGPWDHEKPEHLLSREELNPFSEAMAKLQKAMGVNALSAAFSKCSLSAKPSRLHKPRRLLGGASVQMEEVGYNTFGATLSADFGHIFNPRSRRDRIFIAKNAYIPSRRRERYVDPIDRVIRASRPPSETNATLIEDTGAPTEVIEALRGERSLEHQVLLIVGSVGAGKSTFIDYLQEVALPRELVESTVWLRLNMNPAPVSATEIYSWIRTELIAGFKDAYPDIDFDDLATLEKIFSVEVNKFSKGLGKLYSSDKAIYNQKLAELLEKLLASSQDTSAALARYCAAERGKLLILVLDNCDKRTRDEQLLMFQAAQWIQREFRALVILPLREETYDNHRDQPPLDTALKDLVFRVEPPLFHSVLVKRVQLVLNQLNRSQNKTLHYELPNGFHVEYAASDQAFYLASILHSIFEHDRSIRRIILGLSGRSIRRALEIFLEFCTSGHIREDQIFRIRQSEGKHALPLHLVTRVLLRLNRRFYDSDHSYIKNLLDANRFDERPAHFARLMILRWLHKHFSDASPQGIKGYVPIRQLKEELSPVGVEAKVLDRELDYLVKGQCVLTEDLRTERFSDEDLVRLAPAGFVHLDMMENVSYLAAVAEDTVFTDRAIAEKIAERIRRLDQQYETRAMLANARDLIDYLDDIRNSESQAIKAFLENSPYELLTNLDATKKALLQFDQTIVAGPWLTVESRFPVGTRVQGLIVNVKPYGVHVEIEPGIAGLVKRENLPQNFQASGEFMAGEAVWVTVMGVNAVKRNMHFQFNAFVNGANVSSLPS